LELQIQLMVLDLLWHVVRYPTNTTTTHPHRTPTIPPDNGDGHDGRALSSRRHCCSAGLPGTTINVAMPPSPCCRCCRPARRRVYHRPPERDRGLAAAATAALAQWVRPPTRGVQAGAALDASDRKSVHAACRSTTAPWAIKRAERAQRRQGGIAGGKEDKGRWRGRRCWWGCGGGGQQW
jgi:hypothetical protein